MTAADRRSQIVDVAIELFARKGFRGTTTREIAEAADVSEAMIFRHFATKEELYRAIIDRKACQDPAFLFPEEAARKRDDFGVFNGIARRLLDHALAEPSFVRLLFYSGLEGHELSRLVHQNIFQKHCKQMSAYLDRRVREGALRPVDPLLAARSFLGMLFHYINSKIIFGDDSMDARLGKDPAEFFVRLFLEGLQCHPIRTDSEKSGKNE